ncbi:MAG: hypothetical protein JNK90_21900 [Planctomycetaceae bacterium]|nr:hypothetical protein [Planctomycetaceae bacterium]MBN8604060.1 AAA family ATPase [Planctomycetota bacterium]
MSESRKKKAAAVEQEVAYQLPGTWDELLGHERPKKWFDIAVRQGRLASTFLFVGKDGIGKRTFAKLLAKALFCKNSDPTSLHFCGTCEACVQVDASTHPDLIEIGKPDDKSTIPVDLLIGPPEARMREGLCHDIRLKAFYGGRKVAILDDADTLQEEGANCLLKTLEEPPPGSVLILIGTSEQKQLPTIRSRCQIVRFRELQREQVHAVLERVLPQVSAEEIKDLAGCADGSISQALLLKDPELRQFRYQLYERLAKCPLDFMELAKAVGGLADAAGKDVGALKRARMKIVFEFGERFYRQLLIALDGKKLGSDDMLQAKAETAAKDYRGGRHGALACWQRCQTAAEDVDRFINQSMLIEAWAADLAKYSKA